MADEPSIEEILASLDQLLQESDIGNDETHPPTGGAKRHGERASSKDSELEGETQELDAWLAEPTNGETDTSADIRAVQEHADQPVTPPSADGVAAASAETSEAEARLTGPDADVRDSPAETDASPGGAGMDAPRVRQGAASDKRDAPADLQPSGKRRVVLLTSEMMLKDPQQPLPFSQSAQEKGKPVEDASAFAPDGKALAGQALSESMPPAWVEAVSERIARRIEEIMPAIVEASVKKALIEAGNAKHPRSDQE